MSHSTTGTSTNLPQSFFQWHVMRDRAYVTTKAEAFAAPVAFYYNDVYEKEGKNHLSLEEQLLILAYNRLHRPDLAECVTNGRIYHRLKFIIGYPEDDDGLLVLLNALNAVSTVGKNVAPAKTMEEWCDRVKDVLKDDERFSGF